MARLDELRLMAKVARMYYVQGRKQPEIAAQLDLSQATVSRLLQRALREQVVRITVSSPRGAYPELEEALQARYGLKEAIVVDATGEDDELLGELGAAGAYYLESTIRPNEVVGISAWSATLLAVVEAMHPSTHGTGTQVVQILGGIGSPAAAEHATHLTRLLATRIRGTPVFLPAPGVVSSPAARQVYLSDQYVQAALRLFDQVSLALVGIGALEPSRMLATSGNVFAAAELATLRAQGAVGDICLRFFDAEGAPMHTPLTERVLGMDLPQLRGVKRAVGIAGGQRKLAAIRGALAGRWINVLVTDRATAELLVGAHDAVAVPATTEEVHR